VIDEEEPCNGRGLRIDGGWRDDASLQNTYSDRGLLSFVAIKRRCSPPRVAGNGPRRS